ncbi:hypothetical protein OG413_20510 [Streptomyces sp. NBC_01433]|uniref:hypothetical protein n=1 Tax=Streptomyces sp. NBC_01433 TaxID=2903864 RepID=UPI00225B5456|nr:hypothetical protein [Streptomyces sp. NBC_01433]MCX4677657.1 hypothetical protein [Streptomyces sp. NBC_01433]
MAPDHHLEGPFVTTLSARFRSLRLLSAGTATATATALLLTGCSGDTPSTPACRTVHSKAGDLVPPGVRPCVVYGSGTRPADGGTAGHNVPAGSSGSRTPATTKPPATPKAPTMPKAPAVKAPAVKAPSLAKVR